jgi:hypothetical protein
MLWYHRFAVTRNSDEPSIEALVAEGQYARAAKAATEAGDHARAAELFEKLWDFRGAYDAARAGNDLPRALRYAIELGANAEIATTL